MENTDASHKDGKQVPDSQSTPLASGVNKKLVIIAGGALIVLVLCPLVIIIVLLLRSSGQFTDIFPVPTVTVTPTGDGDIPAPDTSDDDPDESTGRVDPRVAYLRSNNVWIMNNDGSNKEQITDEGTAENRYSAIAWKEPGNLGMARCSAKCRLYRYQFEDGTLNPFYTLPPFTQVVDALGFAHDEDTFGFIFRKADDSFEAVLNNGTEDISVKMWPPIFGRGIGYNDDIQVLFSEDDGFTVFHFTFGDQSNTTIVVTDSNGIVVREIAAGFNPAINGSDGFYFTKGGYIKYYDFAANTITNVFGGGSFAGDDLDVSPDGNFVAFWSYGGDEVFRQYYWDVAGSSVEVTSNVIAGQWLNNAELIGIRTVSPILGMGFDQNGLAKINRVSGEKTNIENASVFRFTIERTD